MRFRTLDIDHDWTFGSGKQGYSKDLSALMFDLKTRILSWVGDCFFDQSAHIDWKNLLDYRNSDEIKTAIKKVAARTQGVLSVSDVELEMRSNRNVMATFSVDTIFGAGIANTIRMN